MTINFNSPEDEVDGTNITIHAIGDTKSIYENRDTGVEKSVSDLLERHKQLTFRADEITDNNGINYDTVLSVESIVPGLLTRNMPVGGYTFETSKTNLAISLEAINAGKLALLTGAVVIICGFIYKMVQKIINYITGNGKNVEKTMENIDNMSTQMKELEKTTSQKEIKLKQQLNDSQHRVEFASWVNDNNDVKEIMFRICRAYKTCTGIVVDPAKPVEAIKTFVDKRGEHRSNAQGNILAAKLPAIMFSDDLDGDFKRYFEYYSYLKSNIRKITEQMTDLRGGMVRALSGTKTPMQSYDYSTYLTPISALLQKKFALPLNATKELKEQVTNDWLTPYRGPVKMEHIGNIMHLVQETPLLKQLVAITSDKILETEIATLMKTVTYDLENSDSPHQKSMQDLRDSQLHSPEEKAIRIRLSEGYMNVIKENLNIIKVIAETNTIFFGKFITSVKSIELIVHQYNAYYIHYNMLLDKYDAKFS